MNFGKKGNPEGINNEKGMVLVIALLFLFAISLLMVVSVMSTTTDTKIAVNYRNSIKAFYDAEAGVQYTLCRIDEGLTDGTLSLPDANSPLHIFHNVPSGFSFDPNITLTYVTDNRYRFRSIGHSGNSLCELDVDFVRDTYPGLAYGIFGGKGVDLKSTASVYSYNSNTDPNAPLDPNNSLGNGDVGSNGYVEVHNNVLIDGDVALGDDGAGTEAVYKPTGCPTVTGTAGIDVPRISPDPLGAASLVSLFSIANDNTNPPIVADVINTTGGGGGGTTVTLTAGNYYLTSLVLGNGDTLNIDTSSGPVNIYMHGGIDAKNGSTINISGKPTDFSIFCDTTNRLSFKHGSGFKGLIYAPFAEVWMHNSSYVHGMIWANQVEMKNSSVFWYDEAIGEAHTTYSNNVDVFSWRDIQVFN
ncbi:hypothetical protein JXL19_01260 [bacterium]|nr:hypothetical protein [bacterium]